MAGIPTLVLTRSGFEGIVANAFAGFGFPAEASMGHVFPSEMFLVDSDLTPLEENFEEFVSGLTAWEPNVKEKGLIDPELITVKGDDYYDATYNVTNLFYRNLWADSLPVIPPTESVVSWIMTGTDRDPGEIIGKIPPRGGIVTVRGAAICLAMAGGRPEYLPVLLAIAELLTDQRVSTQSWNATTNSVLPAVIVNGPIARELRVGSGYAMFGPDPTHPTNGILGRAMRFLLQDIGGATPGTGTMAVFGGMRATNAVFAEDEEGLPETWKSVAEERGFTRDQNVVTLTTINGMANILWDFGGVPANNRSLNAMALHMAAPNPNKWSGPIDRSLFFDRDCPGGIVVIPRGFAVALQDENGFDKQKVKEYLWEHSKVTKEVAETFTSDFFQTSFELFEGDMIPAAFLPEQIMVVVGGGDQSGHGYHLSNCIMGLVTSKEVQLPPNWDDLLFNAEIDMGAAPTAH